MRATVMYGAGDFRVENVPDAMVREPTDAALRVLRSCICGSDLWPYYWTPASEDGRRMGHEFLGVLEDISRTRPPRALGGGFHPRPPHCGKPTPERTFYMPKFLFEASYTVDGVNGLRREGGSSRPDAVARGAESLGGRLERFYFALGDHDAYALVDLPDNESATAVASTVSAAGAARVRSGAPDAGRSRRSRKAHSRLPAPSGLGGAAPRPMTLAIGARHFHWSGPPTVVGR